LVGFLVKQIVSSIFYLLNLLQQTTTEAAAWRITACTAWYCLRRRRTKSGTGFGK